MINGLTLKVVAIRSKILFDNDVVGENFAWNLKDLIVLIKEYIKSPDFACLLTVKTVVALGRVCKNFHNIFNSSYIEMVIQLGNLNKTLRLQFWAFKAPWMM